MRRSRVEAIAGFSDNEAGKDEKGEYADIAERESTHPIREVSIRMARQHEPCEQHPVGAQKPVIDAMKDYRPTACDPREGPCGSCGPRGDRTARPVCRRPAS